MQVSNAETRILTAINCRIFADNAMTIGTTRAGLALVHGDLTRQIIGAFYDVYNELGPGFLESVYRRALAVALTSRGVPFEREVPLAVMYRGSVIGDFRADIVVDGQVIVECKVAPKILQIHEVQTVNYLRATRITVGLILNFGPQATFRRLLLTSPEDGSLVIRS